LIAPDPGTSISDELDLLTMNTKVFDKFRSFTYNDIRKLIKSNNVNISIYELIRIYIKLYKS
jgi:hypothetical protein